jgi:hypothetical protein
MPEQSKRNCCLERNSQVSQRSQLIGARDVQPSGKPWSQQTNMLFSLFLADGGSEPGVGGEDGAPALAVAGSGREEG